MPAHARRGGASAWPYRGIVTARACCLALAMEPCAVPAVFVKEIGFGVAFAVILDATLSAVLSPP